MDKAPAPDVFFPDDTDPDVALSRTTHLGIGAHPDDLEIMAIPGILAGTAETSDWFSGVVVCDGAGSPRTGRYADFSDADMVAHRREEQRAAATLGQYSAVIQLGYSSAAVKSGGSNSLIESLAGILADARPRVLYLHNLADRHATHRAVTRHCIAALRQLEPDARPAEVYGVEVWGSLDWLPEPHRVSLPVADAEGLQARLLCCHDSQVNGGKRYDEAIIARQRANATLANSHDIDDPLPCLLAMNLMPLLEDDSLEPEEFLSRATRAFSAQLTS